MSAVRGIVDKITPGPDLYVALVRLEGDPEGRAYEVPFHRGLLDQWAPEVLRAYLLQQAAGARAAAENAPPHPNLDAVLGEGTASPVTRAGQLGEEGPVPDPCARDCDQDHVHTGADA